MAYCADSDLYQFLNCNATDADSDYMMSLCSAAQKMVETYTGRSFEESSDIRYFDAIADVEGRVLWLDVPLMEVTSITNGDSTTISSDQYVTEPRNDTPYFAITLKDSSSDYWTYDDFYENAIIVDGKWGYASNCPVDLRQATIELAAYLFKRRESDVDLDRPLLTHDGVTIMPSGVPKGIIDTLNFYKRLVIGGL